MADLFDEIDEDLRTQKLKQFWHDNGNWIIGAVIAAIVLTAGLSFYRQWRFDRDVNATAELAHLAQIADPVKLEDFARTAGAGHAAIARFDAAAAWLAQGQTEKAMAAWTDIANARFGVDATWKDLAKLYIALHGDATKLPTLTKDSPWRYTAREIQALLLAREGKTLEATELLNSIAADIDAPTTARTRALRLRDFYLAEMKK